MKLKADKILISVFILIAGMFFWPIASRGANAPKEPTVEDCVEHMGISEEKCIEMIEKFKNMTPEERAKIGPSQGGGPPSAGGENGRSPMREPPKRENDSLGGAVDIETQIENAKSMMSAEEEKFSQMEEKMGKIVEYLKSQNVDTSEAESSINTFKEKAANILSAYDAYIAALDDSRDNNDGKPTDAMQQARDKIRELSADLTDFFRDTILKSLRSQITQLAQ